MFEELTKPDSKLIKSVMKGCGRSHKYVEKVLRSMSYGCNVKHSLPYHVWVADLINQANNVDPTKVHDFYLSVDYVEPDIKVEDPETNEEKRQRMVGSNNNSGRELQLELSLSGTVKEKDNVIIHSYGMGM